MPNRLTWKWCVRKTKSIQLRRGTDGGVCLYKVATHFALPGALPLFLLPSFILSLYLSLKSFYLFPSYVVCLGAQHNERKRRKPSAPKVCEPYLSHLYLRERIYQLLPEPSRIFSHQEAGIIWFWRGMVITILINNWQKRQTFIQTIFVCYFLFLGSNFFSLFFNLVGIFYLIIVSLYRLFGYGIGIHLLQAEDPDNVPRKTKINPKDNHISFQARF